MVLVWFCLLLITFDSALFVLFCLVFCWFELIRHCFVWFGLAWSSSVSLVSFGAVLFGSVWHCYLVLVWFYSAIFGLAWLSSVGLV